MTATCRLPCCVGPRQGCDQCCYEREIADQLYDGVPIGCFPDLYKALSGNMPDQVITL
jgi:hypothetical protein